MKIFLLIIAIQIFNSKMGNGIYIIKNVYYNYYLGIKGNKLLLSDIQTNFLLIFIEKNLYYIQTKNKRKILGIDNNNKIVIYNYNKNKINNKKIWNITKIRNNGYLIQNYFNHNFIEINNLELKCIYSINNLLNHSIYKKNFEFNFIKLVEEKENIKKDNLKIINNEPIDIVIKYIDLTDKTLKRDGINQIYKDKDNEELRYSLRSIFEFIPWIRKIYIVMPNDKVKFLKKINEINDKIIYLKDKDLLGFDSANIHAFTFNLYKLFYFGVAENFIYMEDDFFIGKPLKKIDFFYYDKNQKKVVPYILSKNFYEMNVTDILNKYYEFYNNKDYYHPHSGEGWWMSILNTNKYFIEKYNLPLINTEYTHCARSENIKELKDIFIKIKDYEFINETLFSKERHILTLNQPQFLSLYQLNILHKKFNPIPYKYIIIEYVKKSNLDIPLYVINTGGNHIPLNRQNKIQKKVMEKKFPYSNKYEIYNSNINNKNNKKIAIKKIILNIFLFISLSFIKMLEIVEI